SSVATVMVPWHPASPVPAEPDGLLEDVPQALRAPSPTITPNDRSPTFLLYMTPPQPLLRYGQFATALCVHGGMKCCQSPEGGFLAGRRYLIVVDVGPRNDLPGQETSANPVILAT